MLRSAPLLLSATAIALLAGCSNMNAPWSSGRTAPERAPAPQQICNAQPAQSFVGRTNTSANLEQARQRSGAAIDPVACYRSSGYREQRGVARPPKAGASSSGIV